MLSLSSIKRNYKIIRKTVSKLLFPFLFTTNCFLITFVALITHLLIILIKCNHTSISSLYDLEQSFYNHTEILLLFLSISLIALWNFYLIVFLYVFQVNFTTSTSPLSLTLPELLFNNPLCFMGMLYLCNKEDFFNLIDLTFELIILVNYFTISKLTFAYFGSHLLQTKADVHKEISLIIALTLINFLFSLGIYQIISQLDTLLLFIILGKGVYYELKLLEISVNRISKFNFNAKTNEEKEALLIPKLKCNFHLELLTTVFIYYQFTAMFIYSDKTSVSTSLGTFFLLIVQGYSALRKYMSYEAIKDFIRNLDQALENVQMNDEKIECVRCKERMRKGKRLKCGHVLHLICIERMAGVGQYNCLICHKGIDMMISSSFLTWDNQRNRKAKFGVNLFRRILIRIEIDYDVWEDNDTGLNE